MQFIDLKTHQSAIRADLDRRIAAVLVHGQYIMGPGRWQSWNRRWAGLGWRQARHHRGQSGTEALFIALMALGVGPRDEVITTPFTFVATAEVIVLLGAKPVFVDVEPHTANINAKLIEGKITANPRAIIPVSLYGQVGNMAEINTIGAHHGSWRTSIPDRSGHSLR